MLRRGLFLDRDGVVNEDRGYVGARENFVFKDGIFDLTRAAQDKGYRLVIITNQSGVARKLYTASDYENLTIWMTEQFRHNGINLDLVLRCFEHPEALDPAFRRESYWRKPRPGMIQEAARRLNLDGARSIMIGDQIRDLEAAHAAGIGTRLWLTAKNPYDKSLCTATIHDLDEAVRWLT